MLRVGYEPRSGILWCEGLGEDGHLFHTEVDAAALPLTSVGRSGSSVVTLHSTEAYQRCPARTTVTTAPLPHPRLSKRAIRSRTRAAALNRRGCGSRQYRSSRIVGDFTSWPRRNDSRERPFFLNLR